MPGSRRRGARWLKPAARRLAARREAAGPDWIWSGWRRRRRANARPWSRRSVRAGLDPRPDETEPGRRRLPWLAGRAGAPPMRPGTGRRVDRTAKPPAASVGDVQLGSRSPDPCRRGVPCGDSAQISLRLPFSNPRGIASPAQGDEKVVHGEAGDGGVGDARVHVRGFRLQLRLVVEVAPARLRGEPLGPYGSHEQGLDGASVAIAMVDCDERTMKH